ncbi:MAG: hypothetical protein H0T17_09160, partial [Propionibacteriales bacterium]|nr:hypothetical protein [Propionibacteriales bacterium]
NGFVFTQKDGSVFLATGDSVDAIGQTNQPYGALLAAGDNGPYVTWFDTDASTFKVYDTAAHSEVASVKQPNQGKDAGEFDLLAVLALDGSTAYWHTADGVVGYDVDNDRTEVVKAGASTQWLGDVANGTLARMSFDDQSMTISPDPDARGPIVAGYGHATLSPDARYVATDAQDSEQVFEAATGKDVTPAADGYSFTAGIQWSDDDSYTAVGIKQGNGEGEPFDVLTCSVSSGDCLLAEKDAGSIGDFQAPIGETLAGG